MWFALGFTVSCAFGAYCFVSWLFPAAVVMLVLSLLALVLTHWLPKCRIAAVVLLGISIGLGWFSVYNGWLLSPARQLGGRIRTVTIEALDYADETDRGCAFDGRIDLGGRSYQVRAYLNESASLVPGGLVTGEFRFSFTVEKSTYYQGEGTFLVAYSTGETDLQQSQENQWYHYPAIWRGKLIGIIDNSFPEDTAGFAKALLLGDRSGIDYETSTAFKVGGISHVIAVSGFHVSGLFGLIYLLTARKRVLTAIIGIPAVLIFAAIAGFSPSITRASLMQILMMLAMLWDREYDSLTSLGFAALVMEIINPLVVTSVSFQLSMGCMLGIFLFSEPIRGWFMDRSRLGRWKGRITRWFSSSISVTLGSMVITTPLVAYYFGTVSLIGVVTNLLTLWLITYIIYGIMLVCLLAILSAGAASAAGWVVGLLIRLVLLLSKGFASLPLAAVYTKSIYITLWLIGVYVLLAVYLLLKKKPAVLFTAVIFLGLVVAVGLSWLEPVLWECRVMVLDVGQGQSVILQSQGKTFLVDCGGDYDEGAADTAAETLLSMGIRKLDGIILTHLDADHAGGVEYLLTREDTDAIFLPRMLDESGLCQTLADLAPASLVGEDLVLSFDDTNLTIFAPVSYNSGNESSMCVLFQTEKCDILITGDRGAVSEQLLVKYHQLPKLEVLVVGHHGSRNSTCQELLAATTPEYAFISAGADNRYGHPHTETLSRLLSFGCEIYCTADSGTILFRR